MKTSELESLYTKLRRYGKIEGDEIDAIFNIRTTYFCYEEVLYKTVKQHGVVLKIEIANQ